MSDTPRRAIENFIWTSNPFGLATPPAWFLDQMFAYDPELRIFPSTFEPFYRIMRRTRQSQPWTTFLEHKPDTAIAVAHKLWPVMSVLPQAIAGFSWGRVLVEIAERDQQRFANPDAVERRKQEMDDEIARSTDRQIEAEIDARSGDAYRAYKYLNGERVSLAHRTPDGVGGIRKINGSSRKTPRAAYRPAASGSGAFFTGRGVVPRPKL